MVRVTGVRGSRRARRVRVGIATLLGVACAFNAAAAPPPPPTSENNLGTIKARDALQQMRRFEAAGLPIQAPPANGGQCVIDIGGSFTAGTASGTYRHYEIQRWDVAVKPTPQPGPGLFYAVNWTSTGNGERHEDNGVGTRNDWTFSISAGTGTQVKAGTLASNNTWLVQIVPASVLNGVTVTQQQTVGGVARNPLTTHATAEAFGYPSMTAVPAPTGATKVSDSKSYLVPQNIHWGVAAPGYAHGTISCVWNVSVGP